MADPKPPPPPPPPSKRPSGVFRVVSEHARRAADEFRCRAFDAAGRRCVRRLGHDAAPEASAHRAEDGGEWP